MLNFHRIVIPTAIGVLAACLPIAVQAGNSRFQEAISPDQSMVAYVNAEDGDAEIYIERADRSGRRRLTSNRSIEWIPVAATCFSSQTKARGVCNPNSDPKDN